MNNKNICRNNIHDKPFDVRSILFPQNIFIPVHKRYYSLQDNEFI